MVHGDGRGVAIGCANDTMPISSVFGGDDCQAMVLPVTGLFNQPV